MTTRTPIWLEQDYRFYRDDAAQASATAYAANNTAAQIVVGTNFRVVVNIGDTNNANSGNATAFKLQFRINAGTWTDVGAATAVRYATSSFVSDANNYTTQRLPTFATGTYTSAWNEFDSNNTLTSRTWANTYCEYEFCVVAASGSVSHGDSLTFRVVTTAGGVPNTITNTPTATANVFTRVTNDYSDAYTLRTIVTSSFSDAYTLTQRINTSFADAYTLYQRVQQSYSDAYSVAGVPLQYARPSSTITPGAWQPSTPAASLWDMIDETVASDSDYIYVGQSSSMVELGLSAVADPGDGFGHAVRVRASGNAGQTLRVALMQGAVQIATWDQVLSGSPTTYTLSLSTAEVNSITNYSDLRMRYTGL